MFNLIRYLSLPSAAAISQVLRFFLFVILARKYSLEELASFQLALTYMGLFSFLVLPGFGNYARQRIARGSQRFFFLTIRYRFYGSFLASGIFVSLAFYFKGADQANILMILAVLFPFASGLDVWREWFIGNSQFERLARVMIVQSVLSNGLCILMVLLFDRPEYALVTLLLTNSTINFFALHAVYSSQKTQKFNFLLSKIKIGRNVFFYGLKTSLISSVNSLGNHLDKLILFAFVSPEAMALFAIAEKLPEAVKGLLQILRSYLLPNLSKKVSYDAETQRLFARINAVTLGILFVLILILPFIIRSFFGSNFEDAVLLSQLMTLSLIFTQISQLNYAFIISKVDSRGFTIITGGSNFVKITLGALLIPVFGLYGAVANVLLYRILTVFFTMYAVNRHNLVG